MRKVYIRELSFHTRLSLSHILEVDTEKALRCINYLAAHGVLKLRVNNEEEEYDPLEEMHASGKYQFVYVGLVLFEDLCIVVYPKYLPVVSPSKANREIVTAMCQVFGVLRKNGGSSSQIDALSEDGMQATNQLALMLTLLELYDEWGIYSNQVRVISDNGPGSINWERTIASSYPYHSHGIPIYFEHKTVESVKNTADYVAQLHRCILTECSRFMRESGIAELLMLDDLLLSESSIDDFGDVAFISYYLEREREKQYVTWKQDVIDHLMRYISEKESFVLSNGAMCLGSSSFYRVWEAACKVAFDDTLGKRLKELDIKLAPNWVSEGKKTLLEIIPKPQWTVLTEGGEVGCGDVKTLIPDSVFLTHDSRGRSVFAIFDAKYYTPEFGRSVSGVPGVDSVTKQFMYQSAYQSFVRDHGFTSVINAFIIPSSGSTIEHIGRVRFPGVIENRDEPFSNTIELYALPASMVFETYLRGMPLSDSNLAIVIG